MAEQGWYPDPWNAETVRWFNGTEWTEGTRPNEEVRTEVAPLSTNSGARSSGSADQYLHGYSASAGGDHQEDRQALSGSEIGAGPFTVKPVRSSAVYVALGAFVAVAVMALAGVAALVLGSDDDKASATANQANSRPTTTPAEPKTTAPSTQPPTTTVPVTVPPTTTPPPTTADGQFLEAMRQNAGDFGMTDEEVLDLAKVMCRDLTELSEVSTVLVSGGMRTTVEDAAAESSFPERTREMMTSVFFYSTKFLCPDLHSYAQAAFPGWDGGAAASSGTSDQPAPTFAPPPENPTGGTNDDLAGNINCQVRYQVDSCVYSNDTERWIPDPYGG